MQKVLAALKTQDPRMARLIEQIGPCRIRYLPPDFDTLAKAIIYQQLSGKVAATIYGRLLQEAGDGRRLTADAIILLSPERMRSIGLSRQKIAYLRQLAHCVSSGRLDLRALRDMEDNEVIRRLTEVKGVGVWTAHMFLIFALQRMDILPTGDLGIRVAMQKLYELPQMPRAREMEKIAEKWRPYRTVAAWYLWRSQEPDANL